MENGNISKGEILVVEDTSSSLVMLTEILEKEGYTVRQAQDGRMALGTVKARKPDLVLLDISMPDMDGFEVCERLKADPVTADVPVIFCSALHDTEFKIKGFSVGAVDFVTKPYHSEEVLVRVKTHLELSRLRNRLELLVDERTMELQSTAESLRQEIITRKKTEHELNLASKAFEASMSGIAVTDKNLNMVTVNPAFKRVTGYSRKQCIGKNIDLLYSDKHEGLIPLKRENILAELKQAGTWNAESWCRRRDGNEIPVVLHAHEFRENSNDVSHYIFTLADVSETKDAQTLIDFLVHRDSLTGLANKLVARKHFEQATLNPGDMATKIALVSLDLDRFKVINDSRGHLTGDRVLRVIGERLSSVCESHALIAREGGDEFLLLLSDLESRKAVEGLVEQVLQAIAEPISIDNHNLSVTSSAGIALYPEDGHDFATLLKNGEIALYAAKKLGGGTYCCFDRKLDAQARLQLELEQHLRSAATNGEFQLVYQPKIAVVNGEISGAEALVRWNNPHLGMVSPADFIPLAEESGLILEIDEWVLYEVCRQIAVWKNQGIGVPKVSVNLSTLQFKRGDLANLIQKSTETHGVPASCLDLEITEGVLMENLQSALPILHGLKTLGVSTSLDDFGTGYSSLSYLQKLPIDTLKIDKSFIDEVHVSKSDADISRTILALGHSLNLNVVAEGVEYQEQFDFLQAHGCNEIQGYFFSKPLPPDDFKEYYLNNIHSGKQASSA